MARSLHDWWAQAHTPNFELFGESIVWDTGGDDEATIRAHIDRETRGDEEFEDGLEDLYNGFLTIRLADVPDPQPNTVVLIPPKPGDSPTLRVVVESEVLRSRGGCVAFPYKHRDDRQYLGEGFER